MSRAEIDKVASEGLWWALENYDKHMEAKYLLGQIAVWDDLNKWHHIENKGLVKVEFVPVTGRPVEQQTRLWIVGSPEAPVASEAPIPVRLLKPVEKDGRPAVKIQGTVYGEVPYRFEEAIVGIEEAREAGHGFNVTPIEQEAA
jgi:hypothetical protein